MTFRMGKRAAMEMHLGNKEVYQVRQGEALVYAKQLTVSQTLDGVTSDAPSKVAWGDGMVVSFSPESGKVLLPSTVRVTMGGVDITDTAFDFVTRKVTLANVTGNVTIEAIGAEVDAEVEWIKTDGSAYINTGVKVAPTVTFHLEMYVTRPNKLVQLFGGRTSSSANKLYALNDSRTSGGSNAGTWNYGNKSNTFALLAEGRHIFDNTSTRSTLKVDGASCQISGTYSFSNAGEDFFIFTINIGSGSPALGNIGAGVGVYSGKMYSSGTLVRDFIPVRKDGVGYLYDTVTKNLFGNAASSGAFTYGNDK